MSDLRAELGQLLLLKQALVAESERIAKAPMTTDVDEFLSSARRNREHRKKYVEVHDRIYTIANMLL
jgi:hypothetical protein